MSKELTIPGAVEVSLQPVTTGTMGMIERYASDPTFDVAKLERLIDLHERTMATQAKSAYFAAFAVMQSEIPAIPRNGRGDKGARYAKDEDIQRVLRPILARHGFMLSFSSEFLEGGKVRIVGKLAHERGHVETSEFVSVADTSGSKNAIQALGSTQSYGKRYTAIALLNLTGTDDVSDDDGAATQRSAVVAPVGYDDWCDDMDVVADDGLAALAAAWKKSKPEFQRYSAKHHSRQNEERKRKAAQADKAREVVA